MAQPDPALIVQARVLRALIFRETKTRFGRHGLGFFWEFVKIGGSAAFFIVLRDATSPAIHRGMEMAPFIVTGILTFYCFRSTLTHVQGATTSNRGLLQFPIVTPLDTAIARWVLEAAIFLALSVIAIGILEYVGLSQPPAHVLFFLFIILVSSFFGFCMGLVFGSIIIYIPAFRFVSGFLMRFLMFTSGLFFVIPELPIKIREVAIYNPVLHLNEFAREAYFRVYDAVYASASYLSEWIVITLVVGLVMERATRRRVAWISS